MSNHFHLIAVGDRQDAISHFMMEVNGQYATCRNATQRTTGRTNRTTPPAVARFFKGPSIRKASSPPRRTSSPRPTSRERK